MANLLNKNETAYFEAYLQQIENKLQQVTMRTADKIPFTTDQAGHWNDYSTPIDSHRGLSWWTNGFYAGILWQLYSETGNQQYRIWAQSIEHKLTESFAVFVHLHHDVGFQFLLTSVADYKITQSSESRKDALHAATLLAGRFNLAGRFIRAWNDDLQIDKRGWSIIDSMMNIQLLYWASGETRDPRFRQIAIAHSNMVKNNFIRSDHSVKHIVEFDPTTGKYLRSHGGQGMGHGSAWSRGQAWAIYGFAVGYEQTQDPTYLESAEQVADYFIAHLRGEGAVPIDFCQPEDEEAEDSSAAVIAVSGLISLAKQLSNDERQKYAGAAERILRYILEKRVDFTLNCDNLVLNSASSYEMNDRNVALIYSDYYLLESVLKLLNRSLNIW